MTSVDIGLELAKHGTYWTGLLDYPGVFVSDAGKMASVRSGKVRILKGTIRGAYMAISAMAKGPYLHQVMCETFYGPRPEGCEVRHLDGNRLNNASNNVTWGTKRENARDKIAHGTDGSGERNPQAKLTRAAVGEMRAMHREKGLSHRALGLLFGVSTMTAYRAVEKKSWK